MSALIPSGSGSGTGSMILAAPITNSNLTATLQPASGTIMTSGGQPAFSAYQSASQTVPNTTVTNMVYGTVNFDTNSNYNSSTGVFTPTVAGYYQISGSMGFGTYSPSVNNLTLIQIAKNGTNVANGSSFNESGYGGSTTVSSVVYLNGSTDYVQIRAYQQNANGQNASTLPGTSSSFTGVLVRPA